MPIDLLLEYLKNHRMSMCEGYYEVYIVVVVEQAQQVFTYKEEPCVMGYEYMVDYFRTFRNQTKRTNPRLYYRSVGVFIPLVENGLLCR